MLKDALAVLGREAHAVQRDAELLGHRARVLKVFGGRAVSVLVLFPVAHEQTLHLPALFLQAQRGDRRVDTAREADDGALHTSSAGTASAPSNCSCAIGSSGTRTPAR